MVLLQFFLAKLNVSNHSPLTIKSYMKTKEIIKRARDLAKPFRVSKGKKFRLTDVDPNDTLEFTKEADKPRAKEALANGVLALAELQGKLYAQDKWAVLLIFQAMDAAGKDGAIKHVMSGVNPQGCQVYSFKSPSAEFAGGSNNIKCATAKTGVIKTVFKSACN